MDMGSGKSRLSMAAFFPICLQYIFLSGRKAIRWTNKWRRITGGAVPILSKIHPRGDAMKRLRKNSLSAFIILLVLLASGNSATAALTTRQFIEGVYVSYWGRAADPDGLNYWENLYVAGSLDYAGIAENFAVSSEGTDAYTFFDTVFNYPTESITDAMRNDFVNAVYRNLFNRVPGDAELTYWTGILASGLTSPGAFIVTVIYSAHEGREGASAEDWDNMEAKILVAEYYSDQISANGITWTVSDNLQQAKDVLAGINKDSDLTAAKSAVDLAIQETEPVTYTYLMAFHVHTPETSQPQYHRIYLAGSQDGLSWTLIDGFSPLSGSVPELVYYNDNLYLFHTGTNHLAKLDQGFGVQEESTISLISPTDAAGYVDPSLIVDQNSIYLFYLPGTIGQDPAGCDSYPCTKTIHSALATDADLTVFTQIAGNRIFQTLDMGSMSDPEIIQRSDGSYLLYVSAGSNVWAFTASNLNDQYTSPDDPDVRVVSNGSGGVPGAIEVNDEVWLYVTTHQNGVEVIRRAVLSDGVTPADESDFLTVVDHTISSEFSSDTSVSSPSIIKWPFSTADGSCSAGDPTTHSSLYYHQVHYSLSNDGYTFTGDEGLIIDHASVPEGVIGPNGRLRIYYINGEPGKHGLFVYEQSEDGQWALLDCVKIDGEFNGDAVDPDIVQLPDGTYRLFFFKGNFVTSPSPDQDATHPIYCASSEDGIDFTTEQLAIAVEGVTDPTVTRLSDGSWLMAMAQEDKTLLAASTDGINFELTGVEVTVQGIPELATTEDGRVRLYLSDSLISSDGGLTWEVEPERFVPGPDPSLVSMPDGTYMMFYKTIVQQTE